MPRLNDPRDLNRARARDLEPPHEHLQIEVTVCHDAVGSYVLADVMGAEYGDSVKMLQLSAREARRLSAALLDCARAADAVARPVQ